MGFIRDSLKQKKGGGEKWNPSTLFSFMSGPSIHNGNGCQVHIFTYPDPSLSCDFSGLFHSLHWGIIPSITGLVTEKKKAKKYRVGKYVYNSQSAFYNFSFLINTNNETFTAGAWYLSRMHIPVELTTSVNPKMFTAHTTRRYENKCLMK